MTRVAIIAAMPGELEPLVRGWEHECRIGVDVWRWRHAHGEWVAACAGMGIDASTRAFAEVEKEGGVDILISAGWAGALRADITLGLAFGIYGIIDARTGERNQISDRGHPIWLVTSPVVADANEKQRLATAYQAWLVDMEAAGVARLAAMRGIAFYCVKGVSDGFRDNLPDFNRFISAAGRFLLARFVLFAILRPWYWPALLRMGENSKEASKSIAAYVLDILDERGVIRKLNGYPNHKY
jgi:adenosylhomocysteine nucleosidase